MLTQDQADNLYLQQVATEMRNARETRIVNWIQGLFALLGIIVLIKSMLHKK